MAGVGDWLYLYVRNPGNAANPSQIWLGSLQRNPRPIWAEITYPLVVAGAAVLDTSIFVTCLYIYLKYGHDDGFWF